MLDVPSKISGCTILALAKDDEDTDKTIAMSDLSILQSSFPHLRYLGLDLNVNCEEASLLILCLL